MTTHGIHDPALGWYSKVANAWHDSPEKIGRVIPATEANASQIAEYQRMQRASAGTNFKAQPNLDVLLRLRDSERAEDRAKFDQVVTGPTRITLGDYEAAKQRDAAQGGA